MEENQASPQIEVRGLTMAFGSHVVQRDVGFDIHRGEIFVIMGDSGCGKSTLMRHMIGLHRPAAGRVLYGGTDFWDAEEEKRALLQQHFGVLYQTSALFSAMTLEENVSLPLLEYSDLSPGRAGEVARLKLALVGLDGFEEYYPSEISGGMRKRAGLARAMALDPEILYFDEPSAGLDPLSSRRLDDLILELRDSLGTTVVLVTHELPSIFELGDNAVFLDAERKTMIAQGKPSELKDSPDPKVRAFMSRGAAMSAKTHPRLVGAFVLGAVALVLAAIVLLSSGGLFQERDRFVVFFPGSVKGLQTGSQVTFRGVRVGEVIEVSAFQTGLADNPIQIEVVCEFYGNVVKTPEGVANPFEDFDTEESVALLIEQGIRARMMSASLLTGQKYIELDFMPDDPARVVGLSRLYPEIPTTPTAMEKLGARMEDLMNKLAEVPLDQVVENVQKAIRALREILESPDLRGALDAVHRGANSIEPTLAEARKALKTTREFIGNLGKETDGLGDDVSQTLAELRERMARTEQTFDALEATLHGADDARVDVSETLIELERALKAFRSFVEYVQTHPEAMIQGKEKK